MSQENLEVVRRCFDLFAKGNYAATLASFDPAVETTVAHLYAFEDGKIVRWRMFNSGTEALRAVGLSE